MKEISIQKASSNEINVVLSYLKEAALWLKSKNIDYWQNWIEPQAIYVNWIEEGFKNNEFYFAFLDKTRIGCFRLQCQDDLFWGKRDDPAGYIHSFTTSRNQANSSLGSKILEAIESYCRSKDKTHLRLDCGKHIKGLRKYYESQGFMSVGDITVHGEELILYEKPL